MIVVRKKQKARYSLVIAVMLIMAVISMSWIFADSDDFGLARQEILLRKIGHEVLLRAGDSVSRVLPIQQISDRVYQIRFVHDFAFQPDTLVNIVRRSLGGQNNLPDYIVNVVGCENREVLYGFSMSADVQKNVVPCTGRNQPLGCYLIELTFQKEGTLTLPRGRLIAGLSLLAFAGLVLASPFRISRKPEIFIQEKPNIYQLGNTSFDADKHQITHEELITELTPKENRLLSIFAANLNVIIERSRLQKELWEDEGVIVGRSLDVFISKLRKKMENDTTVELKNIHGKGYRLEVMPAHNPLT